MDTLGNALLGVVFLLTSATSTALMFYLWGFPFDHEKLKSEAPRALRLTHRLLGYVYLAIYLYFMVQMVPRMWTYQIELPARTVAHLLIGLSIGAILVVKISIVRFFKHLEATLVPFLGTLLFISTVLLMGLALPNTIREHLLRKGAMSGDSFSDERVERVLTLLPAAGLDDDDLLEELASAQGLLSGRAVLMDKCVQCHDLRTVLARPRTPEAWRETVQRMADRSTILNAITEEEQWRVTAYLVAISPTLQQTARLQREQQLGNIEAQQRAQGAGKIVDDEALAASIPYDSEAARSLFETRCSQCHSPVMVETNPPGSDEEAKALVMRMVRNGLSSTEEELVQIIRYLRETYVGPSPPPPSADPAPPPATTAPSADPEAPPPATTDLPADTGDEVQVFVVRPIGNEMRFETTEIVAQAGSRIQVIFDNTATIQPMQHNVTFLRSADAIEAVMTAALSAADRGFVPDHEAILASTGTAAPGSRAEVEFTVPPPGEYPYVCLVPAHGFTMRGTLRSVDQ